MKKLFFAPFFFSLLLFSCQKEDLSTEDFVDAQVLKEMSLLKTERERKLTYKMLNEQEKAAIWMTNLSAYLEDDLSEKQKNLIKELINKIEPSIFKAKDEKFIAFGKEWLGKASKVFTREYITKMVVTLKPKGKIDLQKLNSVQSSEQDCGCKVTNDVLTLCGGVWNANEVCKKGNCTETSEFCGFLLLERCNGQCTPD